MCYTLYIKGAFDTENETLRFKVELKRRGDI